MQNINCKKIAKCENSFSSKKSQERNAVKRVPFKRNKFKIKIPIKFSFPVQRRGREIL